MRRHRVRQSRGLGDLGLTKAAIDGNDEIVLPRSRDIRLTLYPVCSTKPPLPGYFGFEPTGIDGALHLLGEPVQFYVRENADDEQSFFKLWLESHQLQALYLRPDPPQVNNSETLVAATVEGSELPQSTIISRLATQLHVDFKGLSLIGKPGERISSVAAIASGIRWRRMVMTLLPDQLIDGGCRCCRSRSARLDLGQAGGCRLHRSPGPGSSRTTRRRFTRSRRPDQWRRR